MYYGMLLQGNMTPTPVTLFGTYIRALHPNFHPIGVIKQNSLNWTTVGLPWGGHMREPSHAASKASKQEVDLNSDILTLEIISGATKKCLLPKEGPFNNF